MTSSFFQISDIWQYRMSSLMRIRDIMAVSSDPIRINLIEWCPIFLGMITLRGKMTFFSGECALIVWLIELFEEKKIHLLLYKILQFLSSLLNPAKHMIHFLAALYSANHLFIIYHQCPMSASVQMFCIYESFSDVPESWVWLRADFQSGSRVLKKGVLNLFLSISMAYNVISCQKVAENTQILKIAKFAM